MDVKNESEGLEIEVAQKDFKKGEKQQFAYDFIKEKIMKNVYKPYQLLSENELSNEMGGISRTPIREALRSLLYEGLVENQTGKGMFVSGIRFEDILEIYEVRISLETSAARLFVQRASNSEIEKLGEILREHEEAFNQNDFSQALECDHQFHLQIAKGTKNSKIFTLCQNYISQIMRVSYLTIYDPARVRKSLEEHKGIYCAILKKDAEKAADMQREHFEELSNYLILSQMNQHGIL